MQKSKASILAYFGKNLGMVVGIVLIWRGIWHILDAADRAFFNDNGLFTAVFGIVLGLAILYLPDKDLKELEKL